MFHNKIRNSAIFDEETLAEFVFALSMESKVGHPLNTNVKASRIIERVHRFEVYIPELGKIYNFRPIFVIDALCSPLATRIVSNNLLERL